MSAYVQFTRDELSQLSAEGLNPAAHGHLVCKTALRMAGRRSKALSSRSIGQKENAESPMQPQPSSSQNQTPAAPGRTRAKRAPRPPKFRLNHVITTRLGTEWMD